MPLARYAQVLHTNAQVIHTNLVTDKDLAAKFSLYYYDILNTIGERRLPAPQNREGIAVSKSTPVDGSKVQASCLLTLEQRFLLDYLVSTCGIRPGQVLVQALVPYLAEAKRRLSADGTLGSRWDEWLANRETGGGAGRP